ncbi:MAG: hypothetical protein ACJ763_14965 [Bdellovibrionia bacterium]
MISSLQGSLKKIDHPDLAKVSEYLDKIGVPHEIQELEGLHQVIRLLPSSNRNAFSWTKMAAQLESKHGVPVYIDPLIPKDQGFQAAAIRIRPDSPTIIALDTDFVMGDPEIVKVLLAHEAVHATGLKRVLKGKAGPDNELRMIFRTDGYSLHDGLSDLGPYAQYFSVDEVKTYAKQGKILKTLSQSKDVKFQQLSRDQVSAVSDNSLKASKRFSQASQDLLTEAEEFLKKNQDTEAVKVNPRIEGGVKEVFDVVIKISRPGYGRYKLEPIYLEIPLYDAEAAKTGSISDLNQKLLNIIRAAKKTLQEY